MIYNNERKAMEAQEDTFSRVCGHNKKKKTEKKTTEICAFKKLLFAPFFIYEFYNKFFLLLHVVYLLKQDYNFQ